MYKCNIFPDKPVAGIEFGTSFPILGELSYDCTLDLHTIPSTVYPPMSHWVVALTFLRSTSQGVDAAFLLLYWVVALMECFLAATPCFHCLWLVSKIRVFLRLKFESILLPATGPVEPVPALPLRHMKFSWCLACAARV